MPKSLVPILAAAVLFGLAALLNPSADSHRDKIRETIAQRSQVERLFGVGQLTAFASRYHSVWVGSYTTVNKKITSVGAFGMVFVAE